MLILSASSKVHDKKMSNKYDNRLPFSKLFERKLSNQLTTVLIFILFVSLPRDVQPKFESSSNYDTMVENNYLLKKSVRHVPIVGLGVQRSLSNFTSPSSGERWPGQVYPQQTKSSTWKDYGKSS